MPMIDCPVCGTPFKQFPSEAHKKRTCSHACGSIMFRNTGQVTPCQHCGKPFYRQAFQAKKGYAKWCSRACHFAARSKKVSTTCLQCSKPFDVANYEINVMGRGKFCSRHCKDVFRRKFRKRGERNMFTNWQKREWKDDKCAKCGSIEKLELDHIVPRFAGGTPERSNAQTLCRTCNRKKFWTDDYELYLNMLKARAEVS